MAAVCCKYCKFYNSKHDGKGRGSCSIKDIDVIETLSCNNGVSYKTKQKRRGIRKEVLVETHYLFLIMNTLTYQTYYHHGFYREIDDVRRELGKNETLVKAWVVGKEVAV